MTCETFVSVAVGGGCPVSVRSPLCDNAAFVVSIYVCDGALANVLLKKFQAKREDE